MFRIGGLRSVAWPALAFFFSTAALAQSANPFVPAEFEVPAKLETKEFRLRMLTVNDVVKDYDAVMTSVAHLKTVWPGGTWPEGLTFEQDLIDLGWHQKEFQMRRSFAYTVVTPSESQVTGCVYINPTPKRGYDAVVYLWARQTNSRADLSHGCIPQFESGWPRNGHSRRWPFQAAASTGIRGATSLTRSSNGRSHVVCSARKDGQQGVPADGPRAARSARR